MAGEVRTGRVSSVDYKTGTYEVTYHDRGRSVTRRINAMSNGEYKMPRVGQMVSVVHNSNGAAAATTMGTIWNQTNLPAEGGEGLYRKEYGDEPGQAFERFDAKTGNYTQFIPGRAGRNCNGEIFDEAKGPISFVAGGPALIKSDDTVTIEGKKGVSIHGVDGAGFDLGKSVTAEAAEDIVLTSGKDFDEEVGGDRVMTVAGTDSETYEGKAEREFKGGVEVTATGEVKLNINGVSVTISASGDISVQTSGRITVNAQQISMTGHTSLTL